MHRSAGARAGWRSGGNAFGGGDGAGGGDVAGVERAGGLEEEDFDFVFGDGAVLDAAGIAPDWRTPAADRRASEALAGIASALLREWCAAPSTLRALKVLEGDGSRTFEPTAVALARAIGATSQQ